jgi:hypothetical protein
MTLWHRQDFCDVHIDCMNLLSKLTGARERESFLRCENFLQAARPILNLGTVYNHVFISSYIDVGSQSLLRWVEVKGSNGQGNQLASTLYEADPQVTAEIERASQPKSKTPAHGSSMVEQQTADLRKIFQSYVVRGTGECHNLSVCSLI